MDVARIIFGSLEPIDGWFMINMQAGCFGAVAFFEFPDCDAVVGADELQRVQQ